MPALRNAGISVPRLAEEDSIAEALQVNTYRIALVLSILDIMYL
jgi:hypothetical protein